MNSTYVSTKFNFLDGSLGQTDGQTDFVLLYDPHYCPIEVLATHHPVRGLQPDGE